MSRVGPEPGERLDASARRRAGTGRVPGSVLIAVAAWLLALIGGGALFVSFTAQYTYILAVRRQDAASVIEALLLDLLMIVFTLLALGLSRAGQSARAERVLILLCAAASSYMNVSAADVASPRSVAAYAVAPVALAVVVDRVVAAGGRARLGRDFWFYFSGQAVSQLGGSFTTFALPLLVFKLTHSATNLALTTVAEFVPYLLFGPLLGAVVDRFDRKRLMLGSDIAQALVIAVIPVLAIGGVLRVADIYAVTFVQSTLGIIFDCGEFAAIPSLVGEQELVTANARIMAANNAGQILGPGLAGALVAFVPVAGLLFVDAGSFLVSSACLALIRCSFNAATPARGAPPGQRSGPSSPTCGRAWPTCGPIRSCAPSRS